MIGGTTPTGKNGDDRAAGEGRGRQTVVTAEPSDPAGFKLTPAHVNLALRNAIGLCETDGPSDPLRRFRLNVLPQEPMPLVS